MVQIIPFSGWRYDLSQVGALSEVTAPPLDVVDAVVQRDLYRQHPCNVIRLVMNRDEPGDASNADRVARADDFLRIWKREGILLREHDAALYVIQSEFEAAGVRYIRWSLIARMRLPESLSTGLENGASAADPKAVLEKTELRATCQTELIPVTVLVGASEEATDDDLSSVLERVVRLKTPIELIDGGQHHRMWPITEKSAQVALERAATGLAGLVVDGIEDLQAAINYRDSLNKRGQLTDPNHPANSVLAWLVPADDSGCQLSPVVFPVNSDSPVYVQGIASGCLSHEASDLMVLYVGNEATASEDAVELASLNAQQPCLAFGTADGHWCIIAAADPAVSEILLRSKIASLCSTPESQATIDSPRKSGRFNETLSMMTSRLFRQSSAKALIIQPAKSASDVLLQHLIFDEDRRSLSCHPHLAIASALPIGLVFSSLETV